MYQFGKKPEQTQQTKNPPANLQTWIYLSRKKVIRNIISKHGLTP